MRASNFTVPTIPTLRPKLRKVPRIREVSAQIAAAVVGVAYKRGLATGRTPKNLLAHIKTHVYDPRY
jgi:hypothetical protein